VVAARACGARAVALTTTHDVGALGAADAVVASIADLPDGLAPAWPVPARR